MGAGGELNALIPLPLVSARSGGRHGGGTALTALGEAVVVTDRAIEKAAEAATRAAVAELEAELAATPTAAA